MKARRSFAGISIALLSVLSTQAQGTFENLNFEQANPVNAGNSQFPYNVTAASGLPYWTVTVGGVQQSDIIYNDGSTGAPAVTLLGPPPPAPFFNTIDGSYSVLLQGSGFPSAASISQTGLIPASTKSLLFETEPGVEGGALNVLIGTQIVPFTQVGTGSDYTLYGANISAWAGQTEQLTFSALGNSSGPNNWEIDDISFSTNSVTPEPGTLSLMLMAVGAYGVRRWRAKVS